MDEAVRYLAQEGVPKETIARVLLSSNKRAPPMATAPGRSIQAPFAGCRRKNHIHDAIVEAALKIEKKLGRDLALALLKDEQVPDEVAARVIAPEPRRIRIKRPAA
ncbi:hypothetical protein SRABI118_01033 [Massilia sp. Bi118]|uniref:hypothetical protein n=1 Tax=Massilia sp. Bi118 TaxID=2822346 RepID=UPI001E0443EC|nr:hypothetical protein [Massilia sp. Bi118]CAH0172600.1 hypothetical protein SRABI118_01033 [Massilia sp. Bi118]